jgi:hypothetical protein
MEGPHADRAEFEAWRQARGWPLIDEEVLLQMERVAADMEAKREALTFCGVPVQHLTEREAKAGLVFLSKLVHSLNLQP